MSEQLDIGPLLEAFVNQVSHPRGRALALFGKTGITVDQAILLALVQQQPGSSASNLAAHLHLSLSSASQMVERLVRQGLLRRTQDRQDRRRKTLAVSPKAAQFLRRLKIIRGEEFALGAAPLSARTQARLVAVLRTALDELNIPSQPSPQRGSS